MTQDRPNFYVILDLDPSVDDWPTIEARILEKKRQWSNDMTAGSPARRRKAEVGKEQLSKGVLETVMRDPAARRVEAANARAVAQAKSRAKEEELAATLKILVAKGSCTRAEIANAARLHGAAFTEAEIAERVRGLGVQIEEDGPTRVRSRQKRERIDQRMENEIRMNLATLNLPNLYVLLGDASQQMAKRSTKFLHSCADSLNRSILADGVISSENSAKKTLLGHCLVLFQSEESKERYDNTLALEEMRTLDLQINIAGEGGLIENSELDALLNLARQKGVSSEAALEYIEERAASKNWRIQSRERLPAEDLLECGFCGRLSRPTEQRCPCGEVLRISCPSCGEETPTQNRACPRCGVIVGDAPVVHALVKEGHRLLDVGDSRTALERFTSALHYWNKWPPALEGKRKAEAKQAELEAELKAIEELVGKGYFSAASTRIRRLQTTSGNGALTDLKNLAQSALGRAEAYVRDAEALRRTGRPEAFDKYEEALRSCADYEPALRALTEMPPAPPGDLSVQPLASGGFRLAWSVAADRGSLRYAVLRKARGAPAHLNDGDRIADVSEPGADDSSPPVGVPLHYAVFTLRGSTCSVSSARSGPHLRMAEVGDLQVWTGSGDVTLRWKTPPGCLRVAIQRTPGSVSRDAMQESAIASGADSLHEAGLRNGTAYSYRISAVYDDPRRVGGELRTPGLRVSATPAEPPPPVVDLTCNRHGRSLTLSWSPVPGFAVQLRGCERPPIYSSGKVIPLAQADAVGFLVPAVSQGTTEWVADAPGQFYFVPLTVAGEMAVVGEPARVTTVDDVANLHCASPGDRFVLTWDWPEGVNEALVAYSHTRYPLSPGDPLAMERRVTQTEYERIGCWELRGAERKPHYFVVFAKAPNAEVYSAGASPAEFFGQTIQVRYYVERKRALLALGSLKTVDIRFQSQSTLPRLPSLLVVAKQGQIPLSPSDGLVVAEVPSLELAGGTARVSIPAQYWNNDHYAAAFFVSPEHSRGYRLMPAAKELLRLG